MMSVRMVSLKKYSRQDWALFILRLTLAVVFIAHGGQKLGNMEMVTGFFGSLGLPAFVAWAIALLEVVAGIALLAGVFVQYAGYAIMAIMVGAIYLLKLDKGFLGGYEYELVLFLVALATSLLGPGAIKLPVVWKK